MLLEIERDLLVADAAQHWTDEEPCSKRTGGNNERDPECEDRRRAEAERLEGVRGDDEGDSRRRQEADRAAQREFHPPALAHFANEFNERRAWVAALVVLQHRGLQKASQVLPRDSLCARSDSPVRSRIPANSRYHQIRCARSCASS